MLNFTDKNLQAQRGSVLTQSHASVIGAQLRSGSGKEGGHGEGLEMGSKHLLAVRFGNNLTFKLSEGGTEFGLSSPKSPLLPSTSVEKGSLLSIAESLP